MEPDLLLAQPNPSRTYKCPNIDKCLRVVPRPNLYGLHSWNLCTCNYEPMGPSNKTGSVSMDYNNKVQSPVRQLWFALRIEK